MLHHKKWLAALICCAMVGTACTDRRADTTQPMQPSNALRVSESSAKDVPLPYAGKNLDEMLLAIDSLSPGFGGMYWDGDSITIVHTRQGALTEASAAVRAVMGDDIPLTRAKGVKLRVAPFDFAQLTMYRSMILGAVPLSGLIMADVDEVGNHALFGVETPEAQTQVMLAAAQLRIPDGAVVATVMPRPHKVSTLIDRQPTVTGGLLVTFNYGGCSLGFNMSYWSSSNYFVTAAHCSPTPGAVDAGWHATQGPCCVNEATEFADPPYTALPGCEPGFLCRYSDASVYLWNTPQTIGLGKIAHTVTDAYGWSGTTGLTITANFAIVGEAPDSWLIPIDQGGTIINNFISKVGATTGWTTDEMVHSCIISIYGGHELLCQYVTHTQSHGGDSGSPMFYYSYSSDTMDTPAYLAGMLWFSDDVSLTTFSSITGIQRDLGALKTYPSKPHP